MCTCKLYVYLLVCNCFVLIRITSDISIIVICNLLYLPIKPIYLLCAPKQIYDALAI